ncbi:hypothetical protein [Andreprevotia chitinilytica]|uniref:hypothetical protein n=1 Tax=Andreprevotia chitinilytica TaxID=396808 RepID=UPI00055461A1|nr:hypothetical protein [Andreprevotia chitinilytica]
MFESVSLALRRFWASWITSGAHLFILLFAWQRGEVRVWLWSLLAVVVLSLLAWRANLKRRHALGNTPCSAIASTAQGYAAIEGRAKRLDDWQYTPSGVACVWFRCRHERRVQGSGNRSGWQHIRTWESDAPFILVDGKAECVLDPQAAEVDIDQPETHLNGDERFTEWVILEQRWVYATGEFSSERPDRSSRQAIKAAISDKLTDWKDDRAALLKRFDADGNGEIDLDEWEAARIAAAKEVETEVVRAGVAPVTHYMSVPRGDQPFLITVRDPQKLIRRYRLWAWLHFVIVLAALQGMMWVYKHPGRVGHSFTQPAEVEVQSDE